jgi:hypothetical protein
MAVSRMTHPPRCMRMLSGSPTMAMIQPRCAQSLRHWVGLLLFASSAPCSCPPRLCTRRRTGTRPCNSRTHDYLAESFIIDHCVKKLYKGG